MVGAAHSADVTVHRCRGADGSLRFQDRACPPGREDPAWDAAAFATRATAPADRAAVAARSKQAALERGLQRRWESDSRRRLPPSLGGSAPRGAGIPARSAATARHEGPADAACRQAIKSRDDAYGRDWMQLGFEQRGRLDAAVRSACKAADR